MCPGNSRVPGVSAGMKIVMWDSLSESVHAGRTEKFTEQEPKDKIQEKWAD
jgi:hypothetical protein